MLLTFLITLAALLNCIIGIFAPGAAIHTILYKKGTPLNKHSHYLKIFAIGIIYNAIQFIVIITLLKFPFFKQSLLIFTKYFCDVLLFSYIYKTQHNKLKETLNIFKYVSPLIIVSGVGLGLYATYNFPHVLGNDEIYWLGYFKDFYLTKGFFSIFTPLANNGALGYLALIYFPGFIINKYIPFVTFAAGYKIFLFFLYFLTINNLVELFQIKHKTITKTMLCTLILLTSFGLTGIFEYGKTSVFATLYTFNFLISLAQLSKKESDYLTSAIFFTTSIILSIVTLPFLIIGLLAYYFFDTTKKIDYKKLILAILYFSIIPISIICLININYFNIFLLFSIIIITAGLIRVLKSKNIIFPNITFLIILVTTIFVDLIAFPINYANIKFRPPYLTSSTNFLDLLHSSYNFPLVFLFLGFAGGLIYIYINHSNKNIIKALLITPFATILSGISIIIISKYSLISLKNVSYALDLIKAIARWNIPIIFIFLSILIINIILFNFLKIKRTSTYFLVGIILLIILIQANLSFLESLTKQTYFSPIGGSKNKGFIDFATTLRNSAADKKEINVFLSINSTFFSQELEHKAMYDSLSYIKPLKMDKICPLDITNAEELAKLNKYNSSFLLLTNTEAKTINLTSLLKRKVTIVKYFTYANETLFYLP